MSQIPCGTLTLPLPTHTEEPYLLGVVEHTEDKDNVIEDVIDNVIEKLSERQRIIYDILKTDVRDNVRDNVNETTETLARKL